MHGVVFLGNKKIEGEISDPKVGEGDVLVRVKASAICGSEMETYVPPTGLPWKGNPGTRLWALSKIPMDQNAFGRETELAFQHSRAAAIVSGCSGKTDFL